MIFIGDIHGDFKYYLGLVENITHTPTVQVGDFGVGFPYCTHPKKITGDHWFIRGNHDNPLYAKTHPNYLGDYGYKEEWQTFYVSGADSIDKHMRVEGRDWWRDEELTYDVLNRKVLPMFEEIQPKCMVTHTCPSTVLLEVLGGADNGWGKPTPKRTERALEAMFEIYQPDVWIFGHFHRSFDKRINGTRFICLNSYQMIEIDGLTKD